MRFIELKHLGVDHEEMTAKLKAGTVTNENVVQLVKEKGPELKYATIIKVIVETVPVEGVDIAKMRKHLRILDVVDAAVKAGETMLEMEDNDYNLLKKLVQAHKWPQVDRNILTFCDDIENAPGADPRAELEAAE